MCVPLETEGPFTLNDKSRLDSRYVLTPAVRPFDIQGLDVAIGTDTPLHNPG